MDSDRFTIGAPRYQSDHGGPHAAGVLQGRMEAQRGRAGDIDAAGAQIGFDQGPGGRLRLGPDPEGRFGPLSIGRLVSFGIVPLLSDPDRRGSQSGPTPQATPS